MKTIRNRITESIQSDALLAATTITNEYVTRCDKQRRRQKRAIPQTKRRREIERQRDREKNY